MLRRIWRRGSGATFVIFILILLPLAFLFHLMISASIGVSYNDKESLELRISSLREQMDHLRFLDKENTKAFVELHDHIERYILEATSYDQKTRSMKGDSGGPALFPTRASAPSAVVSWSIPAAQLQYGAAGGSSHPGFMNNVSGGANSINQSLMELQRNGLVADLSPIPVDLAVPSIYDHLPYLLQARDSLTPLVRISKNRRRVRMTIGIPTVKRPRVSYLITTLRSLIDNLHPRERSEILIVVFIAEATGMSEFITEQVAIIYNEFPEAVNEGLLEILVPSASFYPDFASITPTLGDSQDRMKWRTKQNLDYCYLMMYCQNRAMYYLQLEDDVITKPGYYRKINDYVARQAAVPWHLLEFSTLGFIGKLFRSSDLPLIVNFLLMFYKQKPADWLLDNIFYVRLCSPEKSPKQCHQTAKQYRLLHKPSLFQHIGVHSSLKGKVQKLKEKDFGKSPMHKPHADNPPAVITTSLKTYQKYSLDAVYRGETFFWGLLPQPGDWVKIRFTPPIRLEGFTFRSGNAEHPDDLFYNTSVEISFAENSNHNDKNVQFQQSEDGSTVSYPRTEDGYYVVAWFTSSGAAHVSVNTTGTVDSLRLVVHSESTTWVILSEAWIRPIPFTANKEVGG